MQGMRVLSCVTLSMTLLCLPLAGCGGKGVRLYPARGVVVWTDGQPARELARGTVNLRRVEGEGSNTNACAHGEIQTDGTFVLRTSGLGEGVPAGKYRAIVMPLRTISPGAPKAATPMAPRFEREDQSGLDVTIEPEANQITLTVARASGDRGNQ